MAPATSLMVLSLTAATSALGTPGVSLGCASSRVSRMKSRMQRLSMMAPMPKPMPCDPNPRGRPLERLSKPAASREAIEALQRGSGVSQYEWFDPCRKFELGEPGAGASSPLLVYVPGIDGSGLTPVAQFAELGTKYELKCLSFDTSDRSYFDDIRSIVATEVRKAKRQGRKVYLMGESFGGIVGLSLSMGDLGDDGIPDRLILINAATSFSRTFLGRISPQLLRLPEPFFTFAVLPVGFMILDSEMFSIIAKTASGEYPAILDTFKRKEFVARVYPKLLESLYLKSDDLKWRVKNWVLDGSRKVNERLGEVKVPVLAIAGTSDMLLPSEEEALRFEKGIPDCKVQLVDGAGHAGVIDQRTDLTQLIEEWISKE